MLLLEAFVAILKAHKLISLFSVLIRDGFRRRKEVSKEDSFKKFPPKKFRKKITSRSFLPEASEEVSSKEVSSKEVS